MKQITPFDRIVAMYEGGMSVNQIEEATGLSASTVWRRVKKAGVIRSSSEAISLAISQGRAAAKLRGRPLSPDRAAKLSEVSRMPRPKNARGWRITSQGYVEYTTGEDAGRRVHCVVMERRIGRRLLPDEVVHHIDGDKQNNDEANLALMTTAAHSRLHRIQENQINPRTRQDDGTFASEGISA